MRRQEVKKEVRYDSGPESKRKEGVLKGTMLGVPMTIQFGLRLDPSILAEARAATTISDAAEDQNEHENRA